MDESLGAGQEFAAIEAGRGNDGGWKARKTMVLFPALPTTLEIDEADSHIPTAPTMTRMN
jgi:hypothetical protein